jgi:hypothetical protein
VSQERFKISGKITHVFSHRFVVETPNGAVLADVTPHGVGIVKLRIGADVGLEGERKPSELKVARFICDGQRIDIEHKKKHEPDHHAAADPKVAIGAARAAGFEPIGEPRRKPKHFEVLGLRDGRHSELHIELDGRIRKTKPVDDGHKWSQALRPA